MRIAVRRVVHYLLVPAALLIGSGALGYFVSFIGMAVSLVVGIWLCATALSRLTRSRRLIVNDAAPQQSAARVSPAARLLAGISVLAGIYVALWLPFALNDGFDLFGGAEPDAQAPRFSEPTVVVTPPTPVQADSVTAPVLHEAKPSPAATAPDLAH